MDLIHTNGIHIPHLSASTINSFIESRYRFFCSKIRRDPFAGSEHTSRGTAVEHAINVWIETGNDNFEFLVKTAEKKFDEELQKSGLSPFTYSDFRDTIEGLVDVALTHYKETFSRNKAVTQHKIEHYLDGVGLPLIGYLDFYQEGVAVRDSKVSGKSPSSIKQGYILQGALYRKATGLPVYFDFFIPNKKPVVKTLMLSDDEYVFGLSYLTAAAKALVELESCDDPKRIIELMSFPDLSAMFGNQSDIQKACDTWGIIRK